MQTNEDNSPEETTTYTDGTSTEGSSEPREPEVTGEVEIKKEYDLAKPRRKVIKAKIFPE
jgi:hypothetical protein